MSKDLSIEEIRKYNNEKSKKHREKNKEKIKEQRKKYYESNKEEINKLKREKRKNLTSEKKEKIKSQTKKYKEENKDYIKEYMKSYRQENKEKLKEQAKVYYNNNKENRKKYYLDNKKEIKKSTNNYRSNRKKIDPLYKLTNNIRRSINKSINEKRYTKKSRTYEILGCSYEDLKIHLEKQFLDWMNWDNYGNPVDGIIEPNKSWDIDHIIPLSSASNEKELIKLNHYTNLQPLCSYENRFVKRDSL